jgi:hypothetical protein
MFWGAFTYDKKGPCHIWEEETAAEKIASKKDLEERNTAKVDEDRRMWEITNGVRRTGLRNKPGPKPQFRHIEETGAYIRKPGHRGIDWYHYQ